MGPGRWALFVLLVAVLAVGFIHPGVREAVGAGVDWIRCAILGGPPEEPYLWAERYAQAGDLEKADWACQEALRRDPGHAPAGALRMELQFLRSHEPPSEQVGLSVVERERLRAQRGLIEILDCLDRADRFLQEGRVVSAERNYRKVGDTARGLPDCVEVRLTRRRAQEGLDRLSTGRSGEGGRGPPSAPSAPSSP